MRSLLLFAFISACAAPQRPNNVAVIGMREHFQAEPTYITKHHIKVFCNTVEISRDDLEAATEIFIEYASDWLGVDRHLVESTLRGTTLEWASSYVYTRDYKRTTMSMGAVVGRDVYVTWRQSIAESSLYHEWMHLLIVAITGEHDPSHQNIYWWATVLRLQERAARAGL